MDSIYEVNCTSNPIISYLLEEKIDWSRVWFAFSYGVYLRYYRRLVIIISRILKLILSYPFAILLIIGTLLIPIQTSTEEYVLEVT
jgi:hypothetical protein